MVNKEQVREELKSYKRYNTKLIYIENKIKGVKAVDYSYRSPRSVGENKEVANINDYIEMKEECLKEMERIRGLIESVKNIIHRDILFYRYIEDMNFYEVAEMMQMSKSNVTRLTREAIEELTNIINESNTDI